MAAPQHNCYCEQHYDNSLKEEGYCEETEATPLNTDDTPAEHWNTSGEAGTVSDSPFVPIPPHPTPSRRVNLHEDITDCP